MSPAPSLILAKSFVSCCDLHTGETGPYSRLLSFSIALGTGGLREKKQFVLLGSLTGTLFLGGRLGQPHPE